jgi:hypothetical protein
LATEQSKTGAPIEDRVQTLIPELEAYIASGMKAFDVPGLAIGIVVGDKLVYSKGFGVRSKTSSVPVNTRTIFQIGSTTKAFLATTLAIMVVALGRPRCLSRSGLSAKRPLGHARVPGLRPARSALGTSTLRPH